MISRYLTEGILIAIITVGGYLAAFAYEAAYLKYFGVPIFFVGVDLTIVLIAISTTIIFCIISFFVYLGLLSLIQHTFKGTFFEKIIEDNGAIFSLTGTILLIGIYIYRGSWEKYLIALILFAFLVSFYFILPSISRRFKTLVLQKTSTNLEKRRKNGLLNFIDIAQHPYGSLMLTMIFLWLSMSVGQTLGDASAQTQKMYTVISTNPPAVVLVGYKESLIVVPMQNENVLANHFQLISLDEAANRGLIFSKQELGNLRIERH